METFWKLSLLTHFPWKKSVYPDTAREVPHADETGI
jgi:hypothetical protein